jgi:hypothetical protein
MFTTEDSWQAAYTAAADQLKLAVDQGYIVYASAPQLAGIARGIARAVILSGLEAEKHGLNGSVLDDGDILDGEVQVNGKVSDG